MSEQESQPQGTEENPRPDTPASAHQKKLAQEAAERKKANEAKKAEQNAALKQAKEKGQSATVEALKKQPKLYTKRGNKVLEIEVRENGMYTRYVGNAKKHAAEFEVKKNLWKKAGIYVSEEDIKEKVHELRQKHFGVKAPVQE